MVNALNIIVNIAAMVVIPEGAGIYSILFNFVFPEKRLPDMV
jgi:hypothetical protein